MRGKKMVIKKFALAAASAMLLTTVAFAARPAFASTKVDCAAVMNEISSGKKAKEVATDLSISTSSVYRCKRHAKEAAKAGTKASMQAKAGKEAPSSAMSAPSPAMAAPAAAASPK
jgi:FixJ family two-component response regulator